MPGEWDEITEDKICKLLIDELIKIESIKNFTSEQVVKLVNDIIIAKISDTEKQGNIFDELGNKFLDIVNNDSNANQRLKSYCQSRLTKGQLSQISFAFYKLSSDKENPWGIYDTADCYAIGFGVIQNIKQAKERLEEIQIENIVDFDLLKLIYILYIGSLYNPNESNEWWDGLCKKMRTEGVNQLKHVSTKITENKPKTAFKLFKEIMDLPVSDDIDGIKIYNAYYLKNKKNLLVLLKNSFDNDAEKESLFAKWEKQIGDYYKSTISSNFMFWTDNFDLTYDSKFPNKRIKIPGNTTHNELKRIENQMRQNKNSSGRDRNHVAGSISFVVSDRPIQFYKVSGEGRIPIHGVRRISVPIFYAPENIIQPYFNEHHTAPKNSNDELEKAANKLYKTKGWLHVPLDFKYYGEREKEEGIRLNHSEHGLYKHLCDVKVLNAYVDSLINELCLDEKILAKGYRVYSVIIDIHSTNSLCSDCRKLTHGLYSNDTKVKDESDDEDSDTESDETSPFVKALKTALENKKFNVNRPIKVIVRYSFDKEYFDKLIDYEAEKDNSLILRQKKKKNDVLKSGGIKVLADNLGIFNKEMQVFEQPERITVYVSGGDPLKEHDKNKKFSLVAIKQ